MQLDIDLLLTSGAIVKDIPKSTVIFYENDMPQSFYQILEGVVKISYTNEYGKELTLAIFEKGSSFGEYSLFINQAYPTSALAQTDCVILKLSKKKFFLMLNENPTLQANILKAFAAEIYNKIVFFKNNFNHKAEYRIQAFLDDLKKQSNNCTSERFLIPYTRREIADFTGLRVETVIRIIAEMNKVKKLEIKKHKLYY